MESVDTIVVGAGVVGLAIARAEAMAGREVVILEAAERFGTGTSSRNSEVVHAGIFHPPEMLKTTLCIEGRRALHGYCAERGVPYRRCGKLLVATDEDDLTLLATYVARTKANGFAADEALVPLTADAARALEPELRCVAAWLSPATGIVDAHALMRALLADAEAHGATIAYRTPVTGATSVDGGFRVATGGPFAAQAQQQGRLPRCRKVRARRRSRASAPAATRPT